MSIMKSASVAVAMILVVVAQAATPVETVRVKGRGIGDDKIAALKDAYRDAVERAVGLFVDSEQLADNDKIVAEKILTHSNAYIDRYDLSKETTRNGLVEVEIMARVRRSALTQRLREVMPTLTVNLSEINKGLYAQIVTEGRRDMDAESLLKAEFENFNPLAQLVKVSLVSPKPGISRSKESDDMVRLSYQLKFQIDSDRYFKMWAPRLDKILSQISVTPVKSIELQREKRAVGMWKEECLRWDIYRTNSRTDYFEYDRLYLVHARLLGKKRFIVGASIKDDEIHMASGAASFIDNWNSEGAFVNRWCTSWRNRKAKSSFSVALVKKATSSSMSASIYELSERSSDALVKWMSDYSGLEDQRSYREKVGNVTTFRVSFKDAQGEEVAGQTVTAYNQDMSNIGVVCCSDSEYEDKDNPDKVIPYVFYISPLVGCFALEATTWIDVELPKDDVAKIQNVSFFVER